MNLDLEELPEPSQPITMLHVQTPMALMERLPRILMFQTLQVTPLVIAATRGRLYLWIPLVVISG